MLIKSFFSALVTAGSFARFAQARAVFAHYMIGTVTQAHAEQDIDDAVAMGLDGFALNIGDPTQSFVTDALTYLFAYAETTNFKLYVSMDVYASGDACYKIKSSCNGPFDYKNIFTNFKGSSAWYIGPNGWPMISTFSSGGVIDKQAPNETWLQWRETLVNEMYFIPDFDETSGYYEAADGWWYYWGSIVDGIFSWESAWPERNGYGGAFPGDVAPDEKVVAGAKAHSKGYMMGLSTLQYKNSYGTNIYRAGDLNLPTRMTEILRMTNQPDFIQVLTWNDGPESHYIGNLWPEQNNDTQPTSYATQDDAPHTAWQPLIQSFITAYKAEGTVETMTPASGDAVGAMWYKTILQDSANCVETNNYTKKPDGYATGTDTLNWAVVVGSSLVGGSVRTLVNDDQTSETTLVAGLNSGSATLNQGVMRLELLDASGNIVQAANGGTCVEELCPQGIFNMNYQVVALTTDTAKYGCAIPPYTPQTGDPEPDTTDAKCATVTESNYPGSAGITESTDTPVDANSYFWIDNSCYTNTKVESGFANRGKFYEQAYKDAVAIADQAQSWPSYGTDASDMYFGKETENSVYATNISANIKVAANWDNKRFGFDNYIVLSCQDPYSVCGTKLGTDPRTIICYVNNTVSWWWIKSSVQCCDPFFTTQTIAQQASNNADVDPDNLDLRYLQTSGSFLLHEMMHTLEITMDRGHIKDEKFDGTKGRYIYGPKDVAKAAKEMDKRVTTNNADSYTQFASAIYWKNRLGGLPKPSTSTLPPSDFEEFISDNDYNYENECPVAPATFNCDCGEDGCSVDSAPCCADGSCTCDCDEDECGATLPSCCASGTCGL